MSYNGWYCRYYPSSPYVSSSVGFSGSVVASLPVIYSLEFSSHPVVGIDLTDSFVCPDGWTAGYFNWTHTARALSPRCYFMLTTNSEYADAQSFCPGGSTLASIRSSAELALVSSVCTSPPCWVGFNDRVVEGEMVWDDGTQWLFEDWNAGEPSSADDSVDCGAVSFTRLGVSDCKAMYPAVCSLELVDPSDGALKQQSCPSGWAGRKWSDEDPSMYNRCYRVVATAADFPSAQSACAGLGGYLTSVRNAAELAHVVSVSGVSGEFWVGASDLDGDGTWVWEDGTPWSNYAEFPFADAPTAGSPLCAAIDTTSSTAIAASCGSSRPAVCAIDSFTPSMHPKYTVDVAAGCPMGWSTTLVFDADGNPLPQRCYYLGFNFHSYDDAQTQCGLHAAGAQLASVRSATELSYLGSTCYYSGVGCWVGATDRATEGTWVWDDGTPFTALANFVTDDATGTEDCAAVAPGGLMGDADCSTSTGYVCAVNLYDDTAQVGVPALARPTATAPLSTQCPDDWTRVDYGMEHGVALSPRCYHLTSVVDSYAAVEASCPGGSTLTTVRSEEEASALAGLTFGTLTWIGYEATGVARWADNSRFSFRNWADGEPSSSSGCAVIQPDGTYALQPCSATFPGLCMFELYDPTTVWQLSVGIESGLTGSAVNLLVPAAVTSPFNQASYSFSQTLRPPRPTFSSNQGGSGTAVTDSLVSFTATFTSAVSYVTVDDFNLLVGTPALDFTATVAPLGGTTPASAWVLSVAPGSNIVASSLLVSMPERSGSIDPPNAASAAAFELLYAPPQPTISHAVGVNASSVNATTQVFQITFSSPVSSLTSSDFNVDSDLLVSRQLYAVPAGSSTSSSWELWVYLSSEPAAGYISVSLPEVRTTPSNRASDTFTVFVDPPSCTITAAVANGGAVSDADVLSWTATFSRAVSFFAPDNDFSLNTNDCDIAGTTYTTTVTSADGGRVWVRQVTFTDKHTKCSMSAQVLGGIAQPPNLASEPAVFTQTYDPTPVVLSSDFADGGSVSASTLSFTAVFREAVTLPGPEAFMVSTGTLSTSLSLTGGGGPGVASTSWVLQIQITGNRAATTVSVGLPSGASTPANTASDTYQVVYSPPSASLSSSDVDTNGITNQRTFVVTVSFTSAVANFQASDVDVTAATDSVVVSVAGGGSEPATLWTVTVTLAASMVTSGRQFLTVSALASSTTTPPTASSFSSFDMSYAAPSPTITSNSAADGGSVSTSVMTFTATFTATSADGSDQPTSVTGVVAEDFNVDTGAASHSAVVTPSADTFASTWVLTVTMSGSGADVGVTASFSANSGSITPPATASDPYTIVFTVSSCETCLACEALTSNGCEPISGFCRVTSPSGETSCLDGRTDQVAASDCAVCHSDVNTTSWDMVTCDDNDPCTKDDQCFAGTCSGTSYQCSLAGPCAKSVSCDGTGGCNTTALYESADNRVCSVLTTSTCSAAATCDGSGAACPTPDTIATNLALGTVEFAGGVPSAIDGIVYSATTSSVTLELTGFTADCGSLTYAWALTEVDMNTETPACDGSGTRNAFQSFEAGTVTTSTRGDVTVSQGRRYQAQAAVSSYGSSESYVCTSTTMVIDVTPPAVAGTVRIVNPVVVNSTSPTAIAFTASTHTLAADWSGVFSDATSPIVSYVARPRAVSWWRSWWWLTVSISQVRVPHWHNTRRQQLVRVFVWLAGLQ